jgi:peroxiredoxin
MYPELKKDGWELLAIAVEDPEFKVKRFVKNYNLNFKILLDRFADAADSYDLLGIPTYFFVNKKGEIIFKGHNFPKAKYKSLLK